MKHQPKQSLFLDARPLNHLEKGRFRASGRLETVDGARLQYAALPYRMGEGLEVLLITSRGTGRWVLPKGWPMKGRKPHVCAAREAFEEAGVRGKIGKSAMGSYRYLKELPHGASVLCSVDVYPLRVERHLKHWPEQAQRSVEWFSAADAASMVEEDELGGLIEACAAAWSR